MVHIKIAMLLMQNHELVTTIISEQLPIEATAAFLFLTLPIRLNGAADKATEALNQSVTHLTEKKKTRHPTY